MSQHISVSYIWSHRSTSMAELRAVVEKIRQSAADHDFIGITELVCLEGEAIQQGRADRFRVPDGKGGLRVTTGVCYFDARLWDSDLASFGLAAFPTLGCSGWHGCIRTRDLRKMAELLEAVARLGPSTMMVFGGMQMTWTLDQNGIVKVDQRWAYPHQDEPL
jgi:hypothetical protein